MSDTNVVSQVGNSVEFSFNAILARFYYNVHLSFMLLQIYICNEILSTIAATSTSIQLEQAQSMKCSVSKSFETSASSDLQNEMMPILNGTFELTADEIRLISNEN